ncbi:chitin deacetylase [Basidiobolus ranarum]|uniref:Chitin deacetylase n=1 Tax=Basidiobolus ranarum TaxID=34480 RepID=A0ABR2W2A1_9FUNG
MRVSFLSLSLTIFADLAQSQEAASGTLATINPQWTKQYDLSKVPNISPKKVGSGTCANSPCGPTDCDKCWESCGNCALPDDVYGCTAGKWALSFDDGPSNYTMQLLDILASAKVKATFLMIGSQVVQFPDAVKRAFNEGHQIASHSWSHPHLMSLTNDQIVAEVRATEDAIVNITGEKPAFIRPPYGEADDRVKAIFRAMGYRNLLWNMDTLDWDIIAKKESPSLILDSFRSALANGTSLNAHNDPGFVSLQHDIYIDTVKEVPSIEALLLQNNFTFVLAHECINLSPYQGNATIASTIPSGTLNISATTTAASTPSISIAALPVTSESNINAIQQALLIISLLSLSAFLL